MERGEWVEGSGLEAFAAQTWIPEFASPKLT